MDLQSLWAAFISTATPAQPGAVLTRWAFPVFWGVVLVYGALFVTGSLAKPRGKWIAVVVAVWFFLPGGWSPAYWLGLAFQLPSLMTVVLCTEALAGHFGRARLADAQGDFPNRGPVWIQGSSVVHWSGISLGLVLLLDTFLVFPISLYRWGHSTAMLAFFAGLAAAFWWWGRAGRAGLVLLVLALFVTTRLTTGNVFDALMDPWLWLALVVSALLNWRARKRPAA